jgi:hypothetical protein
MLFTYSNIKQKNTNYADKNFQQYPEIALNFKAENISGSEILKVKTK